MRRSETIAIAFQTLIGNNKRRSDRRWAEHEEFPEGCTDPRRGSRVERNSSVALSLMVQERPSQPPPNPAQAPDAEIISKSRLRSPFLMGGLLACALIVLVYVLF